TPPRCAAADLSARHSSFRWPPVWPAAQLRRDGVFLFCQTYRPSARKQPQSLPRFRGPLQPVQAGPPWFFLFLSRGSLRVLLLYLLALPGHTLAQLDGEVIQNGKQAPVFHA